MNKKSGENKLASLADKLHELKDHLMEGDGSSLNEWGAKVISESEDALRVLESDPVAGEAKERAYHDDLTGLPNRLLFKDRVNEAVARAKRGDLILGVLYLGLDNFKRVNDRLGHSKGDVILKAVAGRLKQCLREVDTISRMGGDEFTILLEDIKGVQGASIVARKIMKSLSKPFDFEDQESYVTASLGITFFPHDGEDFDTLVKHAAIAMDRTKELGKNNYQLFTSSMNESVARRLDLENAMRHAIENEEFVVFYQPKILIDSSKIIGMEALVRWLQPDGSHISPGEFIPLAEETGLIVPIGELVLAKALEDTKHWRGIGFEDLMVSVNLSARQVDQKNVVDVVAKALKKSGLAPDGLCLEVTESSMMKDVDSTISTLNKLKAMGIKISMDDFGTGYSSLSHLKKFPIDELKIDRSFVLNIPSEADDSAITNTIISMAHTLNLSVIAEGVEKLDQIDFLRESGCGEIQGYFFSPPVPKEKFEELLIKQRDGENS